MINLYGDRILILSLTLFIALLKPLSAQAPNDDWRRGAMDAMVAEPGLAGSLFTNPAGMKRSPYQNRSTAESQWIFDALATDFFLTGDTWEAIINPNNFIDSYQSQFDSIENFIKLLDGNEAIATTDNAKTINDLVLNYYQELIVGTGLPENAQDLDVEDLKAMNEDQRKKLSENIRDKENLKDALLDTFTENFFEDQRNLGLEQYLRLLSLTYADDRNPLAWGFYVGIEEKAVLRRNLLSTGMPLQFTVKDIDINTTLPIGVQLYVLTPIRLAFAHDFGGALPGFTFGIGLKLVPYLGINHVALGNLITASIEKNDLDVSKVLTNAAMSLGGMNLGLDFGLQYQFAAIMPQLEFLYAGLKISDLIGFNIPFDTTNNELRYAIDFDLGIYADYEFSQNFSVFGGVEIIQLRGMFPGGQSPYSALFEPIDHLRLLTGMRLINNIFNISAQYYNSTFSPAIIFDIEGFQIRTALNLHTVNKGTWGLGFGLRYVF